MYSETQLQNPQQAFQNPQQWGLGIQGNQGNQAGLGQAAFGQQWGGGQQDWGQQRQLSAQDVGEVVRQIAPLLPQIIAQANQQNQPQAAFGYGGYGMQQQRTLSQQDVNEVVRQILPLVPHIVGMLQQGQGNLGSAMYGQQQNYAQQQNPFQQQNPLQHLLQQQNPFSQQTNPQFQAAYGNQQGINQQRQLSQQDVQEVVRQLAQVIPQAIGGLQAFAQQRN